MPNFDSLAEYERKYREMQREQEEPARRRVVNVGISAESVQGMDGYETWVAHLTKLRDIAAQSADSLLQSLADGSPPTNMCLSDYVSEVRRAHTRALATQTAYQNALDLIPTLIKRGAEASADLSDL